jgi:hypothetical protein
MTDEEKQELKAIIEEILAEILAERRDMPVRNNPVYIGGFLPLSCVPPPCLAVIEIDELPDLEVKQKVLTIADKAGEKVQDVLDKLAREAMVNMISQFIREYPE